MHSKGTNKSRSKLKFRRIDDALNFLHRHPDMSARKAAQIYKCDPSFISKRLAGKSKSQALWAKARQLLTLVKEDVLVK
jgi:hypothetical protein